MGYSNMIPLIYGWILENPVVILLFELQRARWSNNKNYLTSETVEGLALTLEGVHDVHGRDSLATGMLGVGDRVTDDILEEDLEDTASLLIDETTDTLDTTTTSQTADRGLGNALDVVTKDLAVTLGASLSKSFASFSSSRHDEICCVMGCDDTMNRFMRGGERAAAPCFVFSEDTAT
jgi:hypothetical protein